MRFELFLAVRYLRVPRRNRLAGFTAAAAIVGIAVGVAALIAANAVAAGFRRAMQDKILANTAHISVFRTDGAGISNTPALVSQIKSIENVRTATATTFDNVLLVGQTNSAFAVLRGMQHDSRKIELSFSQTEFDFPEIKFSPKQIKLGSNRTKLDLNQTEFSLKKTEFSLYQTEFILTQTKLSLAETELSFRKIESRFDTNTAVETKNLPVKVEIGRELSLRTHLQVGDYAQIIAGGVGIGADAVPVATTVEIGGIVSTGIFEYDSTLIRTDLETAARLTGRKGAADALEIETADIYSTDKTARKIAEMLGADFRVVDWQEANRPLFAALSLERRAAVLIISLIVFVAVLNVTTTLALVVNERKSDIAVLKTCGARAKSIVLIFLFEGALLGAIGTAAGVILGAAVCAAANYFRLINLPAEVYSIGEIVLQPTFTDFLLPAAAAFLLSLIASAIPALNAARIRPLDILRF